MLVKKTIVFSQVLSKHHWKSRLVKELKSVWSLPKSIVQALGTDEGLQQALDSMTIINVPIDNSSVETVCINKNGNSTYFQ